MEALLHGGGGKQALDGTPRRVLHNLRRPPVPRRLPAGLERGTLVSLGAAALATGYWAAMVNFNRNYLGRANRRLLQERRRLERLEQELREDERKRKRDQGPTRTTRDDSH